MEKYSLFRGHRADGHPNVHLIEPGTRYGLAETADLEKTASGEHLPEVQTLVEAIQPQPDRLYLLNSALGSGEYVGFNLRGDWFTEEGLLHTPPGWNDIPVWDIDGRRKAANHTEKVGQAGLAWGFPTFYNAHRFRHHVNKDPNRAYGYILGAFWDPRMHRVILVSELIRDMCVQLGAGHIYDRIAGGDFPDTSMGAKVPYDICSICGHRARSPEAYCEHVNKTARAPYGMRSILPDGRMCGVYNTHPRFFDDSFVFVGAERSAKTMSNLTDLVQGEHEYNQTIYPFSPGVKIASGKASDAEEATNSVGASVRDGTHEDKRTREEGVAAAMKDVFRVPEPDDTPEQKLSRLLDGMPLSDEKGRTILRYLSTLDRAERRLKSKEITPREFELLKGLERRKLRTLGITDSDIDAQRDMFKQRMMELLKMGSTKHSDILKQIPLPAKDHLATIRVHEKKLPDLPLDALEYLADKPGERIKAAAVFGVVLRPHEFQYVLLKNAYPEKAAEYLREGVVFHPVDLQSVESPYSAHASKEAMEDVAGVLIDVLEKRSFAPKAVRSRLLKEGSALEENTFREHSDPLLDEVAHCYNEYRAGLLAHPPDWRYVAVSQQQFADMAEESKLATASIELSEQLLRLAYWPAVLVG